MDAHEGQVASLDDRDDHEVEDEDDDVRDDGEAPGTPPDHGASASVSAEAELDSRFVFRGLALSRGAVLAPSLWATAYGTTASLWANATLDDELGNGKHVRAIVPSIVHTLQWGHWAIEPGLFVYASPADSDAQATSEASLELSVQLGAVRLRSDTKVDVRSHRGAYFGAFGARYERASGRWTLDVSGELGWGSRSFHRAYFDVDVAAFDVIEAGLAVRYQLSRVFYLTLHTELSTLVARSLQASVEEPTLMHGGTALGLEL